MSNAILNNVTYADLQGFLTPYHQRLHEVENFPPLNPNKAMHIAAKSMGLANAHVMKAQMDAANTQSGHDNTQTGYDVWEDDSVQFTRLVAEFGMAAQNESVSLQEVAASMDLDMPEIYTLFARAETAFEAMKTRAYQPKAADAAIDSVIIVVFSEKADSSDDGFSHTDIKVAKNWEAAEEMVADRVRDKGMARGDYPDELYECLGVTVPDEDDDIDLTDAEAILEYVIENNGMANLIRYLEYLDYGLTSVEYEQKWL